MYHTILETEPSMHMHANSRIRRKTGMLMDWTGGKMYYRYILIAESSFSLPPHILHCIVDPSFAQFSSSSSVALHRWIHSHHPLSSAALHYLGGLNWSLKLFFPKEKMLIYKQSEVVKGNQSNKFSLNMQKAHQTLLTKVSWKWFQSQGANLN